MSFWIRSIVAPVWARREHSPYLRVAAGLEGERHLPLEARRARQWKELEAMISHVWENCPYYRHRFREVGFEPGDLRRWDDLRLLPILTKQDVRENAEEITSRVHAAATLLRKRTSGSTGVSLHLLVDDPCTQWRRGVALLRDRWTGWNLGEWRAAVWGNPPEPRWRHRLRNTLLDRTVYLDTLRMDEAMMEHFARTIRARSPTLLWGHAHSLYLLARFWRERAYTGLRLKAVLSTAMVLHDHERSMIEKVFGAPVFNRYGCEEVSLIASECERHEGLHVNTDSLVVEIDRRNADPAGHVIVTDLRNRGMPFVRYEVGDRAIPSDRTCSCGRSYPLLESVTGRVADYLYTPRGELVSGISLTENFATLITNVRQVQIVQEELTHLRIRVVPEQGFGSETREAIAALVQKRFGAEMTHEVEILERIPQEPTGKYRFAICRIMPPRAPSDAFGMGSFGRP